MSGQDITYSYSLAFKQKVVSEIESGHLTVAEAKRVYDITHSNTLYRWIRQLGKDHLIKKVIRVEMKDEKDKLKELERKNRELESALAQAHIKTIVLESVIESIDDLYGIDAKKKFGSKASSERSKK
jgi:transposase-like protein